MDRITHLRLEQAIEDCARANTRSQWARLVVDTTMQPSQVRLQYGPIHTNGFQECMSGEATYIWNKNRIQTIICWARS